MLPQLRYHENYLYFSDVSLAEIAEQFGTPCYVYSKNVIDTAIQAFQNAFSIFSDYTVCFAVKANSNHHILKLFASKGMGFDLVSGGELTRVFQATSAPKMVVFSGVGKSCAEIEYALDKNIDCFNVESLSEVYRLNDLAQKKGKKAPIAFRINPEIDAQTHPYISTALKHSKFGIPFQDVFHCYHEAARLKNIEIKGISYHIGSQILSMQPLLEALKVTLQIVDQLAQENIVLSHLDLGGGMGICYQNETPFSLKDYAEQVQSILGHRKIKLVFEPGRALVGNAGVLLTRVEYIKDQHDHQFAIVDAGMNDLIRPALYQAWHNILPIYQRHDVPVKTYDVVGPVCESGDFLGHSRPLAIAPQDVLAIASVGAYGFSVSSNYNSRPRPPEILIDRKKLTVIRRRETFDDLLAPEYV